MPHLILPLVAFLSAQSLALPSLAASWDRLLPPELPDRDAVRSANGRGMSRASKRGILVFAVVLLTRLIAAPLSRLADLER